MATVRFSDVTHKYPNVNHASVENFSLHVDHGEFMVILGPAESGKSTLLRMLHGLEKVSSGTIHLGDVDITRVPPADRDVALAFENYALYPHMSVGQNMGFALRLAGRPLDEVRVSVIDAAETLGLDHLLMKHPQDLEGSERLRVALGRAIVRRPQVLLMDEPLLQMPQGERTLVRTQLKELQRKLGITTVYATASVDHAIAVADRIALLSEGRLLGVGTPEELRGAGWLDKVGS